MKFLKSKRIYIPAVLLAIPASLFASYYSGYSFNMTSHGSVGGSNQTGYGWGNLAVGWNNLFNNYPNYSAAVGSGLVVHGNSSLVVGSYNAPPASPANFIVGRGTSAPGGRSNALEVLTNGNVRIPGTAVIGKVPESGGISMGDFTAPEP